MYGRKLIFDRIYLLGQMKRNFHTVKLNDYQIRPTAGMRRTGFFRGMSFPKILSNMSFCRMNNMNISFTDYQTGAERIICIDQMKKALSQRERCTSWFWYHLEPIHLSLMCARSRQTYQKITRHR